MNIFRVIAEIYNNYKDYNKTIRELSRLSDKELKDLGITRNDIYSIAANKTF